MSKGINKVILVGNLGNNPEVRYGASGAAVATISIATSDTWKDKSDVIQERTQWHRVVFFNRLAEVAGEYLRKGQQIYIEGKLQTRKWQDQNGQDRYTTEVVANEMQMLGGSQKDGKTWQGAQVSQQSQQRPNSGNNFSSHQPAVAGGEEWDDDDIPFVRSDYALPPLLNESACRLLRSNDYLVAW